MKKTVAEIISLFLTVVSCLIQWFKLPTWLCITAIVVLILSGSVLLFLIISDIIKLINLKNGIKKKKRIKKAISFIYNSSPRFALYGGNLSWANDYKEALKQRINEGVKIEVYYDNIINYNIQARNSLNNNISILKEIGCEVYQLNKVYGLRCILCFSQDDSAITQIYEVKKIKATKKNKKNKYLVTTVKQDQDPHLIQNYTAIYNMTKTNIIQE